MNTIPFVANAYASQHIKSILVMMRGRDKYQKKARKFNRSSDWTENRRLRNLVTSLIRKARKTYFTDKLQDYKSNSRSFWIDSSLIPNKSEKSSIWNSARACFSLHQDLSFLALRNQHEMFKALKELDQSKATECDGISTRALKLAATKISQNLSHLFNE